MGLVFGIRYIGGGKYGVYIYSMNIFRLVIFWLIFLWLLWILERRSPASYATSGP